METKDTAVALLKEWKQLKSNIDMDKWTLDHPNHFSRKFVIENIEKAEVISRRLDEKAEAVGITIIGDKFAYESENVSTQGVHGIAYKFIDLPAREQQAIQEWLLIKNEEKTA
jgi:hypothetical protein